MKKVIIDCDPGIDDSIALLLAFLSPELQIEAVTTVAGNGPVEQTSMNALKIAELAGRDDVLVARGMHRPLARPLPDDPFSHGEDGLGNTFLPKPNAELWPGHATDLMAERIKDADGITLIATAPLTNIAMIFLKHPELTSKVEEVIAIAGVYGLHKDSFSYVTGCNPVSEWNVYVDPEAAAIVFHSGLHITVIGLDVLTTPKLNLRQEDLARLRSVNAPISRYVLRLVDFLKTRGFETFCMLLDAVAVAVALDKKIARTEKMRVDIEISGSLTRGQTVVDRRRKSAWSHAAMIDVVYEFDYTQFHDILIDRLISAAMRQV